MTPGRCTTARPTPLTAAAAKEAVYGTDTFSLDIHNTEPLQDNFSKSMVPLESGSYSYHMEVDSMFSQSNKLTSLFILDRLRNLIVLLRKNKERKIQ